MHVCTHSRMHFSAPRFAFLPLALHSSSLPPDALRYPLGRPRVPGSSVRAPPHPPGLPLNAPATLGHWVVLGQAPPARDRPSGGGCTQHRVLRHCQGLIWQAKWSGAFPKLDRGRLCALWRGHFARRQAAQPTARRAEGSERGKAGPAHAAPRVKAVPRPCVRINLRDTSHAVDTAATALPSSPFSPCIKAPLRPVQRCATTEHTVTRS